MDRFHPTKSIMLLASNFWTIQVEGVTSEYWVDSKKSKSNAASHDKEAARKLWDVSSELTKADYNFLNA